MIGVNDLSGSVQYVALRGISQQTMRYFGALTTCGSEGEPIEIRFPYGDAGYIVRTLDRKSFKCEGEMHGGKLFGQDKFTPAQGMSVTVTEGAFDAMAAYQMIGKGYPVVSIRSAAQAKADCQAQHKFLDAFDKIYLCFDADEPGQKALREVASLFNPNKVYHVQLSKYKDANDYLLNGASKEFERVWWNARKYLPKGIVSTWQEIDEIIDKQEQECAAEYPFQKLQRLTYGIRFGEVNLITAQEKVGKTEFMRAVEYHLLKNTDHNIGIIHLEEGEKRCVQGLIGYHLEVPAHLPDSGLSPEDMKAALRDLTKRDDRLHFYSHFGSDDPDVILDTIRAMVTVCDCRFIFLDHISMIVAGTESEDERQKLDYISASLKQMAKDLQFALFLVSHVNDNNQTRGSRYIGKVADLIINLTRDLENPLEEERCKTYLTIKGNRFAGKSGPAGILTFDADTFKLSEVLTDFDPGI